ncbi:MAG: hypothetical protein AVDCRST_MAG69-1569 [uncultured Solirubrobacteraceae bacterium]|uniref:Regulatory protein RecX n=1 Tax=uncultured Solirubrobacteraceae bacterium TaxID=1162706 RepID=A0A6J4SC20_9ACTN|nr:MAG: hypothetical protein AVDCRST_MAG69-1569 [uncultured Solirubrobacteraceae bacterium]
MDRSYDDRAGDEPDEVVDELGSDGGDRLRDPEAALQRARDLAWRSLNRRDRTVFEVREMLAAKGADPAHVDQVVAEISELGHLDDAGYAQRFTEDRRRLDSWGNERIGRRLRELGVDRAHIERALSEPDRDGEMDRALDLLRRRFPVPPAEDRDKSRALGLLVRRGYESDAAYEALRRHASE